MSTTLKLKILLLIFLLFLAGILLLPTFVWELPAWFKKYIYRGQLKLGLDLKGGVHLVLQPDFNKAIHNRLNNYVEEVKDNFKKTGINFESWFEDSKVLFKFYRVEDLESFKKEVNKELKINQEFQKDGFWFVELTLSEEQLKYIEDNILNQVLEVIRNRIDQFGVVEPVITKQGKDKIVVQLPGFKDPERAINIIGQTAQLEFKLVDEETMKKTDFQTLMDIFMQKKKISQDAPLEEWRKLFKPYIPEDSEFYFLTEKERETGKVLKRPIVLKKQVLLTGDYLKNAQVRINPDFNEPYVWLQFNTRGAKIFEAITEQYVGHRLAIVLDDVVRSAPVIREKISGGEAQITGSFTMEEAHDLALVLRAGALPSPVKILQNITIGPSLGRDSIQKGLIAGLIGASLVIVFTSIYYKISGVVAVIALVLNIYFLLAFLSAFQATLTLPGIAGIILSIGMGVDSNVLIFERIREELKVGRSPFSAIFQGYSKAFWTIFDAHITVLITSLILFIFGTGPIRGFAVTLSVSIIVNLFTAIFVTKLFYEYLYEKGKNFQISFLTLLKDKLFNFMKYQKILLVFSAIFCAIGIIGGILTSLGKANLGIDFTGGILLYLKSENPVSLDKIRKVLLEENIRDFTLQDVKEENLVLLKIKISQESPSEEGKKVLNILNTKFPEYKFTVEANEEIGSLVSKELKTKALLAILGALAGIILYLTFRFNFYFGIAAGIATFHDVLFVLAVFYLLGKEINLLFITSLLIIAGYSLTDTVVIFDRIRENILNKEFRDFNHLINISISEVFSRTIITTITTLFGSISILIFGGVVLRDFALALTIGFLIGTYSSIFVASPILKFLHKGKIPKLTPKEHLL